jgi:uncharacterized protein (DUF2126 family)
MGIQVALKHKTTYHYDRPIRLGPHVVRLRPAPHTRTPIQSYSLRVLPEEKFLNWQQDPHGNYLARLVFPKLTTQLEVEVVLNAELSVTNPFDFFLEPGVEELPFGYTPEIKTQLDPYLRTEPLGAEGRKLLTELQQAYQSTRRTIDFLVFANQLLASKVRYLIRLEPGVQTPEETMVKQSGSCRDSAWLLVQLLRHLGFAARFTSGYLIQLRPDVKSLDGPSGTDHDFTDLHAWTETYLPGAGWIGFDPTSGLLAGEGHIPLACTPSTDQAAPITGALDRCEVEFKHEMLVERVHEQRRVTAPFTDAQWRDIDALGEVVDRQLVAAGITLTNGGEPTFVSIDDMDGVEWNFDALGTHKRQLAGTLLRRLKNRFDTGALLHFGQGKWYPGEPLPRWALSCYFRRDGLPMWHEPGLIADDTRDYGYTRTQSAAFLERLAEKLRLDPSFIIPAYEDAHHYALKERRLPANVEPLDARLKSKEDRERLARVFEQGLTSVVADVLPLASAGPVYGDDRWMSTKYFLRSQYLFLIPGDSPAGYRLPLDSLPWVNDKEYPHVLERDPLEELPPLPAPRQRPPRLARQVPGAPEDLSRRFDSEDVQRRWYDGDPEAKGERPALKTKGRLKGEPFDDTRAAPLKNESASWVVRTAIVSEVRNGRLHLFLPPLSFIEDYIALVEAIEETAAELDMPILIEGYPPPHDSRVRHFSVTPDPGVIEVNIHPAENWRELVDNTSILYEEARLTRLGTEKFMIDGRHSGTGGGNHVTLGGPTPWQSCFLRRPDLLRSIVSYWHNHPSLSYLFSGLFIGATSQAPRIDEGRHEAVHELEIAFDLIDQLGPNPPPWLIDRHLRHLLVDMTGNTHRTEFCIDKLFSPDTATGRLGLVELRSLEMPPHDRMSLTVQLLIRALLARFSAEPYQARLVRWGTGLQDRFMLQHYVKQDFGHVLDETRRAGYSFDSDWFAAQFEFRFPQVGEVTYEGVTMELRQALEPWHVLGEEPGAGGTTRYVDSTLDRLQVKITGATEGRHAVVVNGRRVPMRPTGTREEFVAGVRYRAWQAPNALHPTIGVHSPLYFELIDTWMNRSMGGCSYYVSHPGGRNYDTFPVNSYEAEGRRRSRFSNVGQALARFPIPDIRPEIDFPLTFDLRRRD